MRSCFDRALSARTTCRIFGNVEPLSVGTPRRKLADFERELLEGDGRRSPESRVRVQLLKEGGETFVLARSLQRAKKESPCCEVSSRACTALCAL